MNNSIAIHDIITNLKEQVSHADKQFDQWAMMHDDWDEPSWLIEACFIQLLAGLEALGMPELRSIAYTEYANLQESSPGFGKEERNPDGGPYSPVLGTVRRYIMALEALLPIDEHTTVTKDVLGIIRNAQYVITNERIYQHVPQNENDVHLRIEAILKCLFPDLKHKPSLSKQIKNFEPDTGIPSIETLVEYKFLSRKDDVGAIADQLLADTRGYTSKDWKRFLYVIYETNRFRSESDWNQLMRDSGVPVNTTVVVLSGEPRKKKPVSREGKTRDSHEQVKQVKSKKAKGKRRGAARGRRT
jgi:hypothetical protein